MQQELSRVSNRKNINVNERTHPNSFSRLAKFKFYHN